MLAINTTPNIGSPGLSSTQTQIAPSLLVGGGPVAVTSPDLPNTSAQIMAPGNATQNTEASASTNNTAKPVSEPATLRPL